MGVGDGDEDMLTPDEAVRRQGAEIFRERAAMCRKAIGDGVRIHEALIARAVFFLNGEISESTHCCAVTVGVTGMKLVIVPAEDDRLAGAAVKIIDNDGMVEVVEIFFKTVHFHLFDLDGIACDIEKLAAQEEAFPKVRSGLFRKATTTERARLEQPMKGLYSAQCFRRQNPGFWPELFLVLEGL